MRPLSAAQSRAVAVAPAPRGFPVVACPESIVGEHRMSITYAHVNNDRGRRRLARIDSIEECCRARARAVVSRARRWPRCGWRVRARCRLLVCLLSDVVLALLRTDGTSGAAEFSGLDVSGALRRRLVPATARSDRRRLGRVRCSGDSHRTAPADPPTIARGCRGRAGPRGRARHARLLVAVAMRRGHTVIAIVLALVT